MQVQKEEVEMHTGIIKQLLAEPGLKLIGQCHQNKVKVEQQVVSNTSCDVVNI